MRGGNDLSFIICNNCVGGNPTILNVTKQTYLFIETQQGYIVVLRGGVYNIASGSCCKFVPEGTKW